MPPTGFKHCGRTVGPYSGNIPEQRGNRLEGHPEVYVFTIGDSTLNTPGMICRSPHMPFTIGHKRIDRFATKHPHSIKTHSIVKSLDCIYAQHSLTQTGLQFSEYGIAQSHRYPLDHTCYDASYCVALAFHLLYQTAHLQSDLRIRAADYIGFNHIPAISSIVITQRDVSDLRGICVNVDSYGRQSLHGQRAAHHTRHSFSCRRTATSAMVTKAIFTLICIVGM